MEQDKAKDAALEEEEEEEEGHAKRLTANRNVTAAYLRPSWAVVCLWTAIKGLRAIKDLRGVIPPLQGNMTTARFCLHTAPP